MQEIWKDIPDYEGYQVSNCGRVRTNNKITYTKKHGKRIWKNRILKFKTKTIEKSYKTGYRVDLWKNNKNKTFLVARLVAFTFFNEDINNHNLTVDHIDGNRLNNNLNNLELVSLKENIKREFEKNLARQTNIEIFEKNTNEKIILLSMSKASSYIGRSSSYISNKIRKQIYENENYKWRIINKKENFNDNRRKKEHI